MPKKKGPTTGTGGHGKRRLEGRGPTPRAEHRPGHPAQRKAAAAKRAAVRGESRGGGRPAGRRATAGEDTVVGRNAVVEALLAKVPATRLFAAAGLDVDKRVSEALRLANGQGLSIREVPRAELDRLTGGAHHQGLALVVAPYSYADPADLLARAADAAEPALIVALDGVTDPRNLGAVVRSAAAFGAHGVVVPERRAAGMTAGAWKASAGAAARLPVARATNLPRTLRAYADAGLIVVGLAGDAELPLSELDGTGPLCLVVGSEGRGLSRLVGERCDLHVGIPIAALRHGGPGGVGGAESLNAGIAAGIALYVVAERRRTPGRL